MSVWNSSSLVASDSAHTLTRHKSSGLLLNANGRHSKQHMVEKKMFGSRKGKHGKDFQIGKKFRSRGDKDSGGMKVMSSSSISPSTEEFEKMLHSSVTHNPDKKKTKITKKFFG